MSATTHACGPFAGPSSGHKRGTQAQSTRSLSGRMLSNARVLQDSCPSGRVSRRGAAAPCRCAYVSVEVEQKSDVAASTGPPQAAPSQRSTAKPSQMDWRAQWWPISFLEDLSKTRPNTFTLLGEPVVVWFANGAWNVLRDCCPHRLVPLSEGRIDEHGQMECGYHGWAFTGQGKCTKIPQGGDPANPRSCAVAYPCVVRQDLLWIKLVPLSSGAAVDTGDIPIIPEIDEGGGWDPKVSSNTHRYFPYSYETLVENLLDVGHVPFTHDTTVSQRSSSSVINLELQQRSPSGFSGTWKQGPRKGALGEVPCDAVLVEINQCCAESVVAGLLQRTSATAGRQDTVFKAPSHLRHKIDAYEDKGFANITAAYCVPVSPGKSRVLVKQPFRFKFPIPALAFRLMPTWISHVGQNTVLEDDVVFLHEQERYQVEAGISSQPIGRVYYMPGASDTYTTAWRRWLSDFGGGGPFGPQDERWLQRAGPRLDREQLLDRFHSHTEHCAACSGALRNVERALQLSLWAGYLLAFASAVCAATALSGGTVPSTLGGCTVGQGGAIGAAGRILLSLAVRSLPAGDPGTLMASSAVLVVGAIAAAALHAALFRLKQRFYVGTWPPPRNRVKN